MSGSIRVEVVFSLREQVWRETSEDPGTDPWQILAFRAWEEKVKPSADLEEGMER